MTFIRTARDADIPGLYALHSQIGTKEAGYFERCLKEGMTILIAGEQGFGIINWSPKYSLYKKLNMPELQDLNVVPGARNKGIASAIVARAEELARDKGCTHMGISVGLSKDYGPAQRLYWKLGYQPDGYGVTYDREPAEALRPYSLNDDLCLMLVKELRG